MQQRMAILPQHVQDLIVLSLLQQGLDHGLQRRKLSQSNQGTNEGKDLLGGALQQFCCGHWFGRGSSRWSHRPAAATSRSRSCVASMSVRVRVRVLLLLLVCHFNTTFAFATAVRCQRRSSEREFVVGHGGGGVGEQWCGLSFAVSVCRHAVCVGVGGVCYYRAWSKHTVVGRVG
jgi:hypothetical protein